MSNVFIIPHLGIGDQFIMTGYIYYLLENDVNNIYILTRLIDKNTLEHLYFELLNTKIFLVYFNTENEKNIVKNRIKLLKNIDIKYFGYESNNLSFINTYFWADSFYIQAGINPLIRFNNFKFPNNLDISKQNYNKLLELIHNNEYILIHDDPSRNFIINYTKLYDILLLNNTTNLPIIYIGLNRNLYPFMNNTNNITLDLNIFNTNSLLNLYHIIQNCKEAHFIDSSIAILADYIPKKIGNMYSHIYVRGNKTQLLYSGIWNFID